MSSVSSIRLPGLATGMDTETMVKEMLTGEQNKIDKAQQKEQTIKWQQEIYREIISEATSLNDKYFSITSKNSIVSSSAWNTLSIDSSNKSAVTATGSAGANEVNYSFDVKKLATSAKVSSSKQLVDGSKMKKDSQLSDLGLKTEESGITFTIKYGEKDDNISKPITIRSKPLYEKEADGSYKLDENGEKILIEEADDISSIIKKINENSNGEVKASFSEMTGEFVIENTKTGSKSLLEIKTEDGKNSSDVLDFLGMKNKIKNEDGTSSEVEFKSGIRITGRASEIDVYSDGDKVKNITEDSNSFTIDGITYEVNSIGKADITSKQDYQSVLDNMNNFVEDYNKLMDKVYDLVTQKVNKDYPPLTEAQKEEMSEDEIEKWEKKAKAGILRNDSEMRRFMDNMQTAVFGDNMKYLTSIGLTSHENYNNKGQLALDEEKFIKALETNAEKVYQTFAGDKNSVFENMKTTMKNYVGGSSSIFAKKAGLEKTASFTNNYYSEQLKKQADFIKKLQNKMYDKETELYKKFGALESSMNKLNNQMSYFYQA